MNSTIRIKLSIMMFLEFFIWGAWFVTLGRFLPTNLNALGPEIGAVFSTQSWGAIIAPFIIGLIADRYFNVDQLLGIPLIIAPILIHQLHTAPSLIVFSPHVLRYIFIYMLLLALVYSLHLKQMKEPEKQFSSI